MEEHRLIDWCKAESLRPIIPAFFSVPRPFPDFNIYSMAVYDLMHTITGVLENWVSTSAVCVSEVGKYHGYKARYYDNIGRLDLKICNIPLKHGVPMIMKHFKDGISGIVGLRTNENSKRTSGSGTLGLIDSQDVPQLVLQMILCIGDGDEIIPSDFIVDEPLGNLLECIITSGKLLLEVYYWCNMKSISLSQIRRLPEIFESALYQFQRLYAFKCWFRNQYSLNDRGIKMHGLLHLIHEMTRTGSLENTNTRIYENKHIEVAKEPFRVGSKRTRFMEEELFERNERKRLLHVLVNRFTELHGDSSNGEVQVRKREPWIEYTTPEPNVVTYKCSTFSDNCEQIAYNVDERKLLYGQVRHCNPMVPVEVMWHQLEQNDSLKRFIRHFKECDKGNITLVMQYMYKTFENMFAILIFMI
jgi:hypothetical protein